MADPKYPITDEDREDFKCRFSYHAPKDDQPIRYGAVRGETQELAEVIYGNCPPSRERRLALTHLEQAIMWANASIERNE